MSERIINFARPDVGAEELKLIGKTIESGWLTTGPNVAEFEKEVAAISGCESAVCFDSCTTALEFALRILGIGPGDEVITTPLTYTATADVIYAVGAKIVFVDTDGESFEMDYDAVENAINSRTKAVIAVDYGGKICNYERIFEIVNKKRGIFTPETSLQQYLGRPAVIADAAHSFAAFMDQTPSGSFADITCFSFHVLKGITTGGEGGAVVWKGFGEWSAAMDATFRSLRHHFQTGKSAENGWEYDILGMGFNRPLTDINGAMGIVQLTRFPDIYARRVELTEAYDAAFQDDERIRPLIRHITKRYSTALHLYPVAVNPGRELEGKDAEGFRNKVILKMRDCGVPCNVHYKPLPMMTAYKHLGYNISDYPNAYKQYASLITIPYHTLLSDDDQAHIIDSLKKAVRECE